mgnify:CR=1 FL=1
MIKFFLAIALTELIVELFVKSLILKTPREFIKSKSHFLNELLSCGYCSSVWVGQLVVFVTNLFYNFTGVWVIDTVLTGLIVHRLSNVLHNLVDKTDKYYDLRYVNSDKDD